MFDDEKMFDEYGMWKCPECGFVVELSYEDLAEVGTPMCWECDRTMNLQEE